MIFCEICGTRNEKDSNYCIHCGNRIAIDNICPNCGTINKDDSIYCESCNQQIRPVAITSFELLFTNYNKTLLGTKDLSVEKYHDILDEVFKKARFKKIIGDSPKEKVLNLAKIFATCQTKSRGVELGYSFGNIISYDDRLDDSIQIATIIHELTHCLLFNIFENILLNIFEVKSSSTLEAFVWYFLSSFDDIKIMNEYCAHTVEGRFIPYGYQNYGSFNDIIEKTSISNESITEAMILGNNFANDIIVLLEEIIDEELRELIKLQYKKDLKIPQFDSIKLETEECFDLYERNTKIIAILNYIYDEASSEKNKKELNFIKEGLESL